MPTHTTRIAVIAVFGVMLICAAGVVRGRIEARRTPGKAAAPTPQKSPDDGDIARLQNACATTPNNKQAQWDLANYYLKNNAFDKAADQLKTIVEHDSTDIDAKLKLADISFAANEYPTAELYYEQATKQNPKNCASWKGLCSSLIKQRRYFEATAAATHCLMLEPNDTESRFLRAISMADFVMQYPSPLSHKSELNRAQHELASLATLLPNNGDVFYQYGRVERALLHRDAAVQQLERAHQLDPRNVDASRLLATSYQGMQKDDKALALMEEAATYQPDNPGVNDMIGRILFDSTEPGSRERALAAFLKAVKAAPYDARMTERLAATYDKLNDLQNARLTYERSTQLDPFRASPFHKLALVYTRLGEPALARQAAVLAEHAEFNAQQLRRIMVLSAKHPDDVNLHLIIADRYRDMKMFNQARDEYFIVLRLDPYSKRVPKEFVTGLATTANSSHF